MAWRDLVPLRTYDVLRELALPLPWLALALLLASAGHTLASLVATGVLFMTGLRVTHGAFHHALGLQRAGDDAVLLVLSVLLGGSMHAIEVTHLHHHRRCLREDDVEGAMAHLPWHRALLQSPLYPVRIHVAALRMGTVRQRRWIVLELGVVVLMQTLVWSVDALAPMRTVVFGLVVANASAAMVGIWAVHRGCEVDGTVARSQRSAVVDFLSTGMFHHLEHHQFPAVPTCRLPTLARRIDAVRFTTLPCVIGLPSLPKVSNVHSARSL